MKNFLRQGILALTGVMLIAACGGGGGSSGAGPSTQPPPSPPPQNQPPTVSAGDDKAVFSGATVTLVADAADSDGSIATYTWEQQSGSSVDLINGDSREATFVAPNVSTEVVLNFQVTVMDDGGLSASDVVSVMVRPAGTGGAPTADAGPDHLVPVGVANVRTVSLIGAGSSDPEGDQIYFSWQLISRPETSTAVIGSPTSDVASLVPDVPGRYLVQLTVTDGLNESEPDTAMVIAGRYLSGAYPSGLTLTADEGPYYLGGVETPFGATVRIEAGTEIFAGYLTVAGALEILGTQESPVRINNSQMIIGESQHPSWYFDWLIRFAIFENYSSIDQRSDHGAFRILDSVFLDDGNQGSMLRINGWGSDQALERNVFVNKAIVLLSAGPGNVQIRNNAFILKPQLVSYRGALKMWGEPSPELFQIEGNSFLVQEGYEGSIWWPCSASNQNTWYWLIIDGCPIANSTDRDFDIHNNHWGTSDLDLIEGWIFDRNDVPEYGIVLIEPLLTTPHPETPDPAAYLD